MPTTLRADIVIHRPQGGLVAAVEVKNREELTVQLAAILRRNHLAHGYVERETPFFLLVSQDRGYLWTRHDVGQDLAPPDIEFAMGGVVDRYAPPGFSGRLRASELEAIVYNWLADVAESVGTPDREPEKTLASCGFLDAIRGAHLLREVA